MKECKYLLHFKVKILLAKTDFCEKKLFRFGQCYTFAAY